VIRERTSNHLKTGSFLPYSSAGFNFRESMFIISIHIIDAENNIFFGHRLEQARHASKLIYVINSRHA
jgi:hypothetical protein